MLFVPDQELSESLLRQTRFFLETFAAQWSSESLFPQALLVLEPCGAQESSESVFQLTLSVPGTFAGRR
jgi:hypothetical protein